MIKYNNSNINDWYYDESDIIKVYRNGAVCYQKFETSKTTAWYTLQDLINTHTVISIGSNKYRFEPQVNGIAYFRVHTDKVVGSNTYVDMYNDNLPSPPYFGIRDDSNISLYQSVDGYSSLKSAANSSTCTWAYWIDANTIEVNAQAVMNDTMNIGFYTNSFPKLLLSFELPIITSFFKS